MPAHDMNTASITCSGCQHAYAESALFCPNCGRPKVREVATDPLLGKLLGERFQVQELIGQGASGTIYRAEHVTLRRKVAIKVLHTELSRDDLAVERFRREATTVAEIDNEHIVEIHDFGRTFDGRLYLAMELLEGETLDSVLAREKTLSVERVADILIQVGEALMEAHAIGYVHRDLRPRNVYLAVRRGKANFVKLLDFGLAKLVETDAQAASTSLGMTFGDPRYMSPEQARGDRIDRRADIYQLGCVAYEMLTGAPPFSGNRVFDILTKQVTEAPAPLPTRRPGVPLWVEASVAKMLAKDPENRFATTTRMVEALRRGLENGEVMEDEIARRRESIPPPSVSRVMQKMGMTAPAEYERSAPLPAPAATLPMPAAAAPQAPTTPAATVVVSAPPPPVTHPLVPPAPVVERKRMGTPELGVPVVPVQAPVAGSIETSAKVEAPKPAPPVIEPAATPAPAPARAKRPSTSSNVHKQGPTESSTWFEEGEQASQAADVERARKTIAPSAADYAFDDEPAPRQRKLWPLALGGLLLVGAAVAAIALYTGGGDDKPPQAVAKTEPPPIQPASAPAPPANVPQSTIIESPTPAPAPAVVTPPVAVAPKQVVVAAPVVAAPRVNAVAPPKELVVGTPATDAHSHDHDRKGGPDFDFGVDDNSRRHAPAPTPPTPAPTTIVATATPLPTPPAPAPAPVKHGVSGTDAPLDPYGTGDAQPAPAAGAADSGEASPEKKAEFYANLGAQQLAASDTAGAAASFQKAAQLDPKSAAAATGMGEIALRQGLFGDAISHLKRAAKLAPRSSNVYTLLGEAYLNSGQNQIAADNFKKALQIDPDNARAREGYNDASSKVPPPTDD